MTYSLWSGDRTRNDRSTISQEKQKWWKNSTSDFKSYKSP